MNGHLMLLEWLLCLKRKEKRLTCQATSINISGSGNGLFSSSRVVYVMFKELMRKSNHYDMIFLGMLLVYGLFHMYSEVIPYLKFFCSGS